MAHTPMTGGRADGEFPMDKAVHELTDSQLDNVCGGFGGNIERMGFSVIANLSPSPDMDMIMAETKAAINAKNLLRDTVKPIA
jgi:hypothetical protein